MLIPLVSEESKHLYLILYDSLVNSEDNFINLSMGPSEKSQETFSFFFFFKALKYKFLWDLVTGVLELGTMMMRTLTISKHNFKEVNDSKLKTNREKDILSQS